MGVMYTSKSMEQKFFEALGNPELLARFNELKAAGAQFSIGPFHVSMKYPGKPQIESQPLEMMPQVVVKLGSGNKGAYSQAQLTATVGALTAMLFAPHADAFLSAKKVDHFKEIKVVGEAKTSFEHFVPEKKPDWDIDDPVAMTDKKARRIGQAVTGTSSTYRVVAYGEKFVVAAVKKGSNQVSLRVEGACDGLETSEFGSLGLSAKGGYMSGHLSLGGVPLERVFGALFFNPKIKLVSKMASLSEAKL